MLAGIIDAETYAKKLKEIDVTLSTLKVPKDPKEIQKFTTEVLQQVGKEVQLNLNMRSPTASQSTSATGDTLEELLSSESKLVAGKNIYVELIAKKKYAIKFKTTSFENDIKKFKDEEDALSQAVDTIRRKLEAKEASLNECRAKITEMKRHYVDQVKPLEEDVELLGKKIEGFDKQIETIRSQIARVKPRVSKAPVFDDLPEHLRAEALDMSTSLIEDDGPKVVKRARSPSTKPVTKKARIIEELSVHSDEDEKAETLSEREYDHKRKVSSVSSFESESESEPEPKKKIKIIDKETKASASAKEPAKKLVLREKPQKVEKVAEDDDEFDFGKKDFVQYEVSDGFADFEGPLFYLKKEINPHLVQIKIDDANTLKQMKKAFRKQSGSRVFDATKAAFRMFWSNYTDSKEIDAVDIKVYQEERKTRGNDCQLCGGSIKKGDVCSYAFGKDTDVCRKHPLHVYCSAFMSSLMNVESERPVCMGMAYDSNDKVKSSKVAGCYLGAKSSEK